MRLNHRLLSRRPFFSKFHVAHYRNHALVKRTFFSIPDLSPFSPFANNGSPSSPGGGGNDEQTYHERKILPYSQKQLYELVADVDNYHRFVPYCTESKVLASRLVKTNKSSQETEVEKKEARLTVGFLAFKESYVSEVTCQPCLSVEAIASSGTPLFKKLVTTWRFQPASPSSPHPTQSGVLSHAGVSSNGDAAGPTLMSIDLVFAFSNPLYAGVSSAFFKQVSTMMVQAFEKRCVQVYGQGER
ncbi:dehydrase and lipid transport-domain-containing protein [Phellopilus nigrolimitatus]|nr:dehydrase and lipid transport-domain-containing protein [Phellopilus nigrolimitatus]